MACGGGAFIFLATFRLPKNPSATIFCGSSLCPLSRKIAPNQKKMAPFLLLDAFIIKKKCSPKAGWGKSMFVKLHRWVHGSVFNCRFVPFQKVLSTKVGFSSFSGEKDLKCEKSPMEKSRYPPKNVLCYRHQE